MNKYLSNIHLIKFLVSDQDPEVLVVNGAHVLQDVHHHLGKKDQVNAVRRLLSLLLGPKSSMKLT